jgi:hypothetical protein
MKILKTLGAVAVALIAVPLIAALIVPQEYGVSERIVINRPLDDVYEFTKYLKNQDEYGKWNLLDPNMEHYYEGDDGKVGFVSGWKSDDPNVGHGEQEILAMSEKQRIDYELRFFKPFQNTSKAFMTFSEVGPSKTEVGWGFDGKMSYPLNLMIPLLKMEEVLSADFETGLENLKELLEK